MFQAGRSGRAVLVPLWLILFQACDEEPASTPVAAEATQVRAGGLPEAVRDLDRAAAVEPAESTDVEDHLARLYAAVLRLQGEVAALRVGSGSGEEHDGCPDGGVWRWEAGDWTCAEDARRSRDEVRGFVTDEAIDLRAGSTVAGTRISTQGHEHAGDGVSVDVDLAYDLEPDQGLQARALQVVLDDLRERLAGVEAELATVRTGLCPTGYEVETDPDETGAGAWTVCRRTLEAERVDWLVKVGDFWIDRYEGWVCAGELGPETGHGTTAVLCSVRGVVPVVQITWFQAATACANAGKRLCTNVEWQTAASGTPDPGESENVGGRCVTHDASRRPTGGALDGNPLDDCVSRFGAEDMIGNVQEVVADWFQAGYPWMNADDQTGPPREAGSDSPWPAGYGGDQTFNVNGRVRDHVGGNAYHSGLPAVAYRGGNWGGRMRAGAFTLYLSVAPSNRDASTGARCCVGGR